MAKRRMIAAGKVKGAKPRTMLTDEKSIAILDGLDVAKLRIEALTRRLEGAAPVAVTEVRIKIENIMLLLADARRDMEED